MSAQKEYYTSDVKPHSLKLIWRTYGTFPIRDRISFPIGFLFFAIRKLLGLRPQASWGVAWPQTTVYLDAHEIPLADAKESIASIVAAFEARGFEVLFHVLPEYIGRRRHFYTYLLSSNGTTFANIAWMQVAVKESTNSTTIFGCSSVLRTGTVVRTQIGDPRTFTPEMLPQNYDVSVSLAETTPHELMARHSQRLKNESEKLLEFTDQTLRDYLNRAAVEAMDHLISKGFYAKLTDDEANRLCEQPVNWHSRK
jgi:hypothetical protein